MPQGTVPVYPVDRPGGPIDRPVYPVNRPRGQVDRTHYISTPPTRCLWECLQCTRSTGWTMMSTGDTAKCDLWLSVSCPFPQSVRSTGWTMMSTWYTVNSDFPGSVPLFWSDHVWAPLTFHLDHLGHAGHESRAGLNLDPCNHLSRVLGCKMEPDSMVMDVLWC